METTYCVVGWERFETAESRRLKELRWVPLPNSFGADDYALLMTHADGLKILGVWSIVLMAASQSPVRGELRDRHGRPLDARGLAAMARVVAADVEAGLAALVSVGRIRMVSAERVNTPDEGILTPAEASPRKTRESAGQRPKSPRKPAESAGKVARSAGEPADVGAESGNSVPAETGGIRGPLLRIRGNLSGIRGEPESEILRAKYDSSVASDHFASGRQEEKEQNSERAAAARVREIRAHARTRDEEGERMGNETPRYRAETGLGRVAGPEGRVGTTPGEKTAPGATGEQREAIEQGVRKGLTAILAEERRIGVDTPDDAIVRDLASMALTMAREYDVPVDELQKAMADLIWSCRRNKMRSLGLVKTVLPEEFRAAVRGGHR